MAKKPAPANTDLEKDAALPAAAAAAPPAVDEPPADTLPPTEEPLPMEAEAPMGVATPDGKGVHPFEVLQAERERTAEAEAKAAELASALEQAQAQLAEAAQANQALQAALGALGQAPEGMEDGGQVAEELPMLEDVESSDDEHELLATLELAGVSAAVKQIPAITAHVRRLTDLVRQLVDIDNRRYQQELEEEQREHEAAMQANWQDMRTAIDNLPLARYYEAKQPEAWQDFIRFHDDVINQHPTHSQLPHAERFRKALDMAKAVHGDTLGLDSGGKVPEDDGAVLAIDASTPPSNTSAEDNVRRLTDAELSKKLGASPNAVSAQKTTVTLSSIPGGMQPGDSHDVPRIKREGIKEFQAALRGAKTPEEASRIQAEWARAG